MTELPSPTYAADSAALLGDPSANGLRAAKSASAFRTISEVAGELDVPQHVLRFWETKFSQVKPLKRGSGRRYYRPEDVELLRSIRGLLYNDGYTIKGVQKLLRDGGIKSVRSVQSEAGAAVAVKPQREPLPVFPPSAPENRPDTAPLAAPPPAMNQPLPQAAQAKRKAAIDPETKASLKALLNELQTLRDLLQK